MPAKANTKPAHQQTTGTQRQQTGPSQQPKSHVQNIRGQLRELNYEEGNELISPTGGAKNEDTQGKQGQSPQTGEAPTEEQRQQIEAEASPMLSDLGFDEGTLAVRWIHFAISRGLRPLESHPTPDQMQVLRQAHTEWVNRPPRQHAGDVYRAVISGNLAEASSTIIRFNNEFGDSPGLCAEFTEGIVSVGQTHHNAAPDFTELVCRFWFLASNGPPANHLLEPACEELEGMSNFSAERMSELSSRWDNSFRSGEPLGTWRQNQNQPGE